MMRLCILCVASASLMLGVTNAQAAAEPAETVRQAEQVLAELVAIPAKQIPQYLLTEAQGIAVIPDVTKIGFIAGVRRGHGVVMVRDNEGEWGLPQFITLTGGSVGWQAGIQGTDVVLVFRTRKGIDGLMRGKFTIGADASVSAGPVGRDAAAATDAALKAEILSYSRSRGLFLGVSIDGSVLEIDQHAHAAFYGSPASEVPRRLPESAGQLRQYLVDLTQKEAPPPASGEPIMPKSSPKKQDVLRRSLIQNATQLHAILNPSWRQYLALPADIMEPTGQPNLTTLVALQQRFEKISSSPSYKTLVERREFQATYEVLREYVQALSASGPILQLSPPPAE